MTNPRLLLKRSFPRFAAQQQGAASGGGIVALLSNGICCISWLAQYYICKSYLGIYKNNSFDCTLCLSS